MSDTVLLNSITVTQPPDFFENRAAVFLFKGVFAGMAFMLQKNSGLCDSAGESAGLKVLCNLSFLFCIVLLRLLRHPCLSEFHIAEERSKSGYLL